MGRSGVLVLGPAVATGAGVAVVGADASVVAAHAPADARLLELEVAEVFLDAVDEAGHGGCLGGGYVGGGCGLVLVRLVCEDCVCVYVCVSLCVFGRCFATDGCMFCPRYIDVVRVVPGPAALDLYPVSRVCISNREP